MPRKPRISRQAVLYEGKAKILYPGPSEGTVVQHFKDDMTAFNKVKMAIVNGKGILNNRISACLMQRLEQLHVPTHFLQHLNMREQLVRRLEMFPVEVVVRNVVAGSLAKRTGLKEGTVLPRPVLEYYYKNDALGDPMINEDHICALEWMDFFDLEEVKKLALRVNDCLGGMFLALDVRLVDMKLEFGKYHDGQQEKIIVGDEISPDTCRLWDVESNEKMDKDRFRLDLGEVERYYKEIALRLGVWSSDEAQFPSDTAPSGKRPSGSVRGVRAARLPRGTGPDGADGSTPS